MKKLSTLKTLPLIGLLAMGLALPAVSMADRDDHRGRDHVYKKHDGGKGHKREHRRIHRDGKGHRDHGRHYSKGHKHGGHNKHVYNRHYKHGHKHYGHKGHRHGHGHKHVDHVVVHNHYDDWDDYDRLRLMLGLHFDNIDIIYRDY